MQIVTDFTNERVTVFLQRLTHLFKVNSYFNKNCYQSMLPLERMQCTQVFVHGFSTMQSQ